MALAHGQTALDQFGHGFRSTTTTTRTRWTRAIRPLLGEVYVSADTAERTAAQLGHGFAEELLLYAVHGALHLVGYDDHEDADLQRMREAERRYAGRDGG